MELPTTWYVLSAREQSETDSRNSQHWNSIEETHSTEQDWQDISECFLSVGIFPLKVHSQPLSGRVNLGKRNLALLFLPFTRMLLEHWM